MMSYCKHDDLHHIVSRSHVESSKFFKHGTLCQEIVMNCFKVKKKSSFVAQINLVPGCHSVQVSRCFLKKH